MAAEWGRLCKGARDLKVDGDWIEVEFAGGRRHGLKVEDEGDAYRVIGVVAKPKITQGIPDIALQVWRRNRATPLVGFRIDARDRLLGESLVPKVGLTPEEFQQWVRVVAAECDRFEHAVAGHDVE